MNDDCRAPRSRLARLGFMAFRETNRAAYLRYAQLRLGDTAEAGRCVEALFTGLGARWDSVLGSERLAAAVWMELRRETGRRSGRAGGGAGSSGGTGSSGGAGSSGRPASLLRDDQADILALHRDLSLPLADAARLMGLGDHEALALLRGAERALGRRQGG